MELNVVTDVEDAIAVIVAPLFVLPTVVGTAGGFLRLGGAGAERRCAGLLVAALAPGPRDDLGRVGVIALDSEPEGDEVVAETDGAIPAWVEEGGDAALCVFDEIMPSMALPNELPRGSR